MSNSSAKHSENKNLVKRRGLLEDPRSRVVIAIILAILSWTVVTIMVRPGTTVTLAGVPVNYSYDANAYISRGLSIVSEESRNVSLSISGDGYILGDLTQDDFVVYPDYSGLKTSGEKNLRLRVKCLSNDADNLTVQISGNNDTVRAVFDVVEEKTLPVRVVARNLRVAEGYILYRTASTAESVTLSGPSSELEGLSYCAAELTYGDELHTTQTLRAKLRYYNENEEEVTLNYASADREDAEVTLTVYKLASLPISINFINAPQNFDGTVLRYSLSRNQLAVAGPENVINSLTSLSIGSIDLSTFALDKVYDMPIRLPNGIVSQENVSNIKVSFDCTRLTTKTMNLPASCVQVINLPLTYQLEVMSERLMNVTLCGPYEDLEGLTTEQVVAQINADDFSIDLGQQNIACSLYVPSCPKVFALGNYTVQCKIESN